MREVLEHPSRTRTRLLYLTSQITIFQGWILKSEMVVGIVIVIIAVVGIGGAILLSENWHENVIDVRSENQINLGQENNGAIIEVSVGAAVIISLPENPSTGFTWQYTVNENILEVMEDNYIPPENALPGAGGTCVLKLYVIGSGDGEVNMNYVQPWENQAADHFSVILRAE